MNKRVQVIVNKLIPSSKIADILKAGIPYFVLEELRMPKELSQKSRRNIYVGAWILIVIQIMALVGWIIDTPERDPAIEALVQKPTSANIGGTIGVLIGCNMLAIVAMIAGLTLWRHGNDEKSKIIIIASIIAIFVGSMLVFLMSNT